ncbi:unnamed protein product, partial [Closterium sp. NIES-65]
MLRMSNFLSLSSQLTFESTQKSTPQCSACPTSIPSPPTILPRPPCSPNPGPAAPPTSNLLKNPRFQDGLSSWLAFGESSLRRVQAANYSYGVSYARREESAGPAQIIRNLPAAAYELAIWVKLGAASGPAAKTAGLPPAGRQYVNAMAKIDGKYVCIGGANARPSCWTKVIGGFTLHRTASEVAVYIQGATVGTEILVTSASLLKVDTAMWRQRQNENIKKHRQRDVTLRVHGAGAVSARVQIDQVTSEFPFGANVNGAILYDKNYQRVGVGGRFNWAVFNTKGKWYFNERMQDLQPLPTLFHPFPFPQWFLNRLNWAVFNNEAK